MELEEKIIWRFENTFDEQLFKLHVCSFMQVKKYYSLIDLQKMCIRINEISRQRFNKVFISYNILK